ncbi:hypothetical protein [Marinicella meishanensis]|uniref:hypothetical protein n=1 Tax=Marinicella meishanensis TaxID=2873263 RepID=UPI001CC0FE5E|nr:hypothetical protein [Marinicella sp. NBU2979]
MKNIAFILVILAFLAGAYMASLDERTMNWTYFLPIMLVGIIAAIIYKRESNAAAKHGDLLQNNKQVLIDSLNNVLTNLEALNGRKDKVPTYEMRFEIDKLFREDLMNFAEARESMKHLFSIQHYADIMSSFAAGERYINRVWSASTDGYVDEVMMYVEKALSQFQHAKEEFDAALNGA